MEKTLKLETGYGKRVVESKEQFYEKLLLWEENMDDRIVELMKVFLIAHLLEENPNLAVEELLFEKLPDGRRSFAVKLADGKRAYLDFVEELYEYLGGYFQTALEKEADTVKIDLEWAAKIAGSEDAALRPARR